MSSFDLVSDNESEVNNDTATQNGWRLRVCVAIAAGLVLVGGGLACYHFRPGVRVTVENAGTEPMRAVVLHVTGRSYPVGEIAPGGRTETIVVPTSESDLRIEFTDGRGIERRVPIECYIEPSNRGEIRARINDGRLEMTEQRIQAWSL
ncbi:MAG TPA: hypothetical protein VGP76_11700 [Planctomycetaceae bacterium]|jgi:hypothetical protein|nr:hypothetical protein [Planctomycetaceae bacterium]